MERLHRHRRWRADQPLLGAGAEVARARALSVEHNELRIDVPPALDAEVAGVDLLSLALGRALRIDGADGDCLEVEAEIETRAATSVGLTLCSSPGGEERTTISWQRERRLLRLDRTHSNLAPDVGRGVHDVPLALAPGEPLTLTVFLDRSVVEAFANRCAALTRSIYPTRPVSTGVELFVTGANARVHRSRARRRVSIW